MTTRLFTPLTLALSLFVLPISVSVMATQELLSLDASVQQPISSPAQLPQSIVQPEDPTDPPTAATQTVQERYNMALATLQEGDWLMKQGKYKDAKATYRRALAQTTQYADLETQTHDRLDLLDRRLQAIAPAPTASPTPVRAWLAVPPKSPPPTASPTPRSATPKLATTPATQPIAARPLQLLDPETPPIAQTIGSEWLQPDPLPPAPPN
jgi:hypothetical protein